MVETVDTQARVVDPFTFEIISHRLYQITREMAVTLERLGGTVNTTQRHDYITALYRGNGDVLSAAESSLWHVVCAGYAVKRIIDRFQDDDGINPGDTFLLNDPYVAAIHQSDVYIISPIHFQDRLVAWSATFVHVTDIGALSPGGNSPGATEICHEGIRIPGIKLIDRGRVRRDVFDAICNMTRQPALVGLDLKCEVGANNVARARIEEVYEQYGTETVEAVADEMISYTERVLRRRLLEIPDGSWGATASIQESNAVVKLTKTGDHLCFDFTGSDPQAKVGINLPYHATLGKCFASVVNVLGWDLPKNEGPLRLIEAIAPPGTLVNVQPPGPVSLNTTSGGPLVEHVTDGVVGQMVARSERWATEVVVRGEKIGGGINVRHAGVNQHGWYYVAAAGGLGGGGAKSHGDGIDSGGGGLMEDHNVEWFESMYPFTYLFRRHVRDGGGAGKFRGGAGQEWAITIHDAPQGRIRCVGYGVPPARASRRWFFGGYPAAPNKTAVRTNARVDELFAQKKPPVDLEALGGVEGPAPYAEFELAPGDVLYKSGSGGRGFGDPLDRDPHAVASDVLQGIVSPEAARDVYGVVVDQNGVDLEATEMTRSRLREERGEDLYRRAAAPGSGGEPHAPEPIDHPLPENLELVVHEGASWVRCQNCGHLLCTEGEDWAAACNLKQLAPIRAGQVMAPLEGRFIFEQLSCPTCEVLFVTELLELEDQPTESSSGQV